MNSPTHQFTDSPTDEGIGGWLFVLCLVLLVWQPVQFAAAASTAIAAMPVRGAGVGLVLAARLIVTAFGAAAGLGIMRRRESAIRVTIAALAAAAIVDVFVELTPYFPSNRIPGDAPLYAAWWALFYLAWMLYVARSARVKRTLTS